MLVKWQYLGSKTGVNNAHSKHFTRDDVQYKGGGGFGVSISRGSYQQG
jgi:hypothetical protein